MRKQEIMKGRAPITGPESKLLAFFTASTDFTTDSDGRKRTDAIAENMLPPFICTARSTREGGLLQSRACLNSSKPRVQSIRMQARRENVRKRARGCTNMMRIVP